MFRRRLQLSSLDRLEREANDDFLLLEELGPEYFGIEHLLELREQARQRLLLFDRRHRLAFIFGGACAGWVLLALGSTLLHLQWLSVTACFLTTLSVLAFFGILLAQKWRYGGRSGIEHALFTIEEELRKRATKKTA